ncbi:MAG: hypothetical protein RL266_141 [Bacteroidota bacterium]|jgi:hypothetical protein
MAVPKNSCSNCNASVPKGDKYCGKCGQEQRNLHVGFGELIKEFVSDNFNFDTRLAVTLRHLLLKPGFLAQEFALGKRASYVPPIRLYLFISFVYFLLASLNLEERFGTAPSESAIQLNSVAYQDDGQNASNVWTVDAHNDAQVDSVLNDMGLAESKVADHLVRQFSRLVSPDSDEHEKFREEFYRNLSLSMFLLMPVFALLLWLFWPRPKPYYIDALIFSIHLHSFNFILLITKLLIGLFVLSDWVDLAFLMVVFTYLTVGLKRVMDISMRKAVGKTIGLSLTYALIVSLSMITIGLASIWLY